MGNGLTLKSLVSILAGKPGIIFAHEVMRVLGAIPQPDRPPRLIEGKKWTALPTPYGLIHWRQEGKKLSVRFNEGLVFDGLSIDDPEGKLINEPVRKVSEITFSKQPDGDFFLPEVGNGEVRREPETVRALALAGTR